MLRAVKHFLKNRKNPLIRSGLLWMIENNKLIKILRIIKFEKVSAIYLEKADRKLFIQTNNLKFWKSQNSVTLGMLNQIQSEKRSIAYEVQHAQLASFLLESTKGNTIQKIVEVGTYKGGTAVFFRRLLDSHRSGAGEVITYDTFDGHPHINSSIDIHPESYFKQSSSETLEYLTNNKVNYVIGDVLETFDFEGNEDEVTFLHLDVDLYEVTKKFLQNLALIIRKNGIVVVDDYGKPSCPGIALAYQETKEVLDQNFISVVPMTYQLVLIRI
jgi:hypothetical protein